MSPAKKTTKKKPAARKSPAKVKASAAKRKPAAASAKGMPLRRADFGAPIDSFFAKQPPVLRAVLEALRKEIDAAAPGASASIKWGMPFYSLDGAMLCALGAHKSHVNLILSGPPGIFADPDGLLSGEGKTGKHLKLTRVEDLPKAAVRGWLRSAVAHARTK